MRSGRMTRQIALAMGVAALVAMGAVSACGSGAKEAPTTSAPASSSSAPSPSEKAVAPGGPGAFSPTLNPAPVPTT